MNLKPGAHIHLMGICGTAMASLAGILQEMGYRISGSDQNIYPPMSTQLEKLGIPVSLGYKKENLEPRPDLVIVGNVITRKHEEAQALLASDIPYTSLPKAMGEFVIAQRHSVVIAGTHGKTTTTALCAWAAEQVGLHPGFLIGGVPKNFPYSFHQPKGDWFIIEGDEYDTAFFDKVPKFVHYRPRSVILTSVEFDHADIYRDLNEVKAAFLRLMQLIPSDGVLVAAVEEPNVAEIIATSKAPVITYGLRNGDFQIRNPIITPAYVEFDALYKGKMQDRLRVQMFGDYNIKNALSVYALSCTLGWDRARVLEGLRTFAGVKRRQEIIGEPGGIVVIEDFAHHPTAVEVTLKGLRERYEGQRIFAVFEPRSATSRRKIFQQDYVKAFKAPAHSQVVVISEPYDQTNIVEGDRFSSRELVADLNQAGTEAHLCQTTDGILHLLSDQARRSDVIVLMSNGGFGGIYSRLLSALGKSV